MISIFCIDVPVPSDLISLINHRCAFCQKDILPHEVELLCSGCNGRAYCGTECQRKDWKPKSKNKYKGQRGHGHKDWCSLSYGEEGWDWEIKPTGGNKGNGVFAKRKIPAGFRIMVERENSWDQEDQLNQTMRDFLTQNYSTKINHACWPNAHLITDVDFKVEIVQATADIQAGEEITLSYTGLPNILMPLIATLPQFQGKQISTIFEEARKVLATEFHITCPPDCFCLQDENAVKLEELLGMNQLVETLLKKGADKIDFILLDKLLFERAAFDTNSVGRGVTLQRACMLAFKAENLPLAIKFGDESYSVFSAVFHPKSERVVTARKIAQAIRKGNIATDRGVNVKSFIKRLMASSITYFKPGVRQFI